MHFGNSNTHHKGCDQALKRAGKIAQKHGISMVYDPTGTLVLVDHKGNAHKEYDDLIGIFTATEAFELIRNGYTPVYDDRAIRIERGVLATGLFRG